MGDGKEHSLQEVYEHLAINFKLTQADLDEFLPSGKQTTFYNRVGWARTYLSKSGLLNMTKRSYYQITYRGQDALSTNPIKIDMKYLQIYPEFISFRESKKKTLEPGKRTPELEEKTPEEILEDAYQEIIDNLAQDILVNIKNCSPAFFERLVVELLVNMGYGGSRKDASRAVGQSGDGGVDGIIDEDRLGLDSIFIQAKKWENVVGRPEIQKFVGALMGKHAKKGVFITTSSFSSEAISYASAIDSKVVLIDGKRLAKLMLDYDIGVTEVTSYKIKRIDTDYFTNM